MGPKLGRSVCSGEPLDEASLEHELTLILGRLDEFAARVKTGLRDADWQTRREIIRALVKRVEIDQEQVRVVFRVNPPPQAPQLPSEKDSQSLQHCRGRDNRPLRHAAVGRMIRPVLKVASIEHGLNEANEAFILNFLLMSTS